jgi:hypothetical protein
VTSDVKQIALESARSVGKLLADLPDGTAITGYEANVYTTLKVTTIFVRVPLEGNKSIRVYWDQDSEPKEAEKEEPSGDADASAL